MHVAGSATSTSPTARQSSSAAARANILFGRAVGSTLLADFAASDWAAERKLSQPDEINLFYRLQAAFTLAELDAHRASAAQGRHASSPASG